MSSKSSAFKKKLHRCRPKRDKQKIQTQRTLKRVRVESCDPIDLQRGVRQLLADKVSGNLVGLWLLIPEHLRLGTWDLLCGWSGQPTERVEPRLALQMVHEAALCAAGLRQSRSLSQRGFESAAAPPPERNVVPSLPNPVHRGFPSRAAPSDSRGCGLPTSRESGVFGLWAAGLGSICSCSLPPCDASLPDARPRTPAIKNHAN